MIWNPDAIYALMLAESKRVEWPEHFTTDLTKHDKSILKRIDGERGFGWVLYRHGTHFVHASLNSRDHRVFADMVAPDGSFGVRGEYPDALFYVWDGVGFHKTTREGWLALLVDRAEDAGLSWKTEVRL